MAFFTSAVCFFVTLRSVTLDGAASSCAFTSPAAAAKALSRPFSLAASNPPRSDSISVADDVLKRALPLLRSVSPAASRWEEAKSTFACSILVVNRSRANFRSWTTSSALSFATVSVSLSASAWAFSMSATSVARFASASASNLLSIATSALPFTFAASPGAFLASAAAIALSPFAAMCVAMSPLVSAAGAFFAAA